MENKTLVAVYGSLRNGLGNHRLLVGQEFLGQSVVQGFNLHVYCSGFPAITQGDHSVLTEVYAVDAPCMRSLDGLEGYPSFYNRTEVQTTYGKAWIYFMSPDEVQGTELIEDGDWVKYKRA